MGSLFSEAQSPLAEQSPWGLTSGDLFYHLTDPRPPAVLGTGYPELKPDPLSSSVSPPPKAQQRPAVRDQSAGESLAVQPGNSTALRTQDDLSAVSEPAVAPESQHRVPGGDGDKRQTLSPDQQWAGRAQLLLGTWVRTKADAPSLDPAKKSADGAWGNDGTKVPKGTALRVAGAVLSDGALMCHWPQFGKPGTAVQYRPVWLHHYHVEATSEPKQIRDEREGDKLATKLNEDAERKTERREGASRQLGQIRRFDEGFYGAVGGVLEALVPNQGDQGRVEIEANLPVLGAGKVASVNLTLKFSFEAERDERGIKARVEVGVGVLAQVESIIVDAFVQAMLFGYLEAYGDNGTEVMRLLSLALYKTVYAQGRAGRKAAGLVWGESFEEDVAKNMDEDDYAEAGLGADLEAGFGVKDPLTKKERGGSLGYRHSRSTRYENHDGDSQIESRKVAASELSLELSIFDGWSGSLSVSWGDEGLDIEAELSREAELSTKGEFLSESNLQQVLIHWAAAAFGQIHGLLSGQSGYQSQALARRVGSAISNVQNIGFGPLLTEGAIVHALAKRIHALQGLKLSQQLQLGLSVEQGQGQITVDLSSLRAIEVGEERSPVHVLLESATRIANLKSNPFAI